MTSSTICTPRFTFAALALSGLILLTQQAPGQQPPPAPAPPSDSAPAAAPIERQPPSNGNPGMRPGMRPGMMHPGAMQQRMRATAMMHNRSNFHRPQGGPMGGGFRIGPEGMWWKNPMVVQKLTLTPEQTKKMDDIFQQSRIQLIDLKANVEKQQVMLEPMLSANPLDTAKAMAQIDKVAQARADLEKSNAKMLLGIRAVLTPDQWTKLRGGRGQGGFGQPGAPGSQGGPGQGGGPGRGPRPGGMDNFAPPVPEP